MHRPALVSCVTVTLSVTLLLCSTSRQLVAAGKPQAGRKVADAAAGEHRAELDRYCVTCHNSRLKTGGAGVVARTLDRSGCRPPT